MKNVRGEKVYHGDGGKVNVKGRSHTQGKETNFQGKKCNFSCQRYDREISLEGTTVHQIK